ncbi:MAG: hypothetical protein HY850_02680 [Betaproteobacteria bacterium]|nr:hypothetical protein [Betaproteobacteria bacterium]
MDIKRYLSLLLLILATASGIGNALGGNIEAKQAEMSARKANAKGNSFAASTVVYPAGTKFTITAIHPDSAFYSYFYSTFYGKTATAADCASGATHGIEYETSGSRVGYYSACFYLDGDGFEYFIWGFKFNLVTTTTTPPPSGSTTPSATYSNGTLVLKRMELDSGSLGKSYYDVVLKLQPVANPTAFSVDSAVPSQ